MVDPYIDAPWLICSITRKSYEYD